MEQKLLSSGVHEFITGFSEVHVSESLVFCVVFVDHCLSFYLFLSDTVWSVLLLSDTVWSVLLLSDTVWSVLLRFTASDYPLSIFNFFKFQLKE